MQIQISWLLKKPTDLDLHCLQRQGISRISRTRANRGSTFLRGYNLIIVVQGESKVNKFIGYDTQNLSNLSQNSPENKIMSQKQGLPKFPQPPLDPTLVLSCKKNLELQHPELQPAPFYK